METLEDHRVRIQDLESTVHRLEGTVMTLQGDYADLHRDHMALLLSHQILAKDGRDRRERVQEVLARAREELQGSPEASEAVPVVEEEAGKPRGRWGWSWARHFWGP